MTIKVTCPGCDESYKLADDKAGKEVRCKHCNDIISVPDPDAERAEERERRRRPESSGHSPLFWILGGVGVLFLLLICGAVGAMGLAIWGAATAVNKVASNMPGAEPKNFDEAITWLGQGGFRAENAAVWLQRQPPDPARRAEAVHALDRAYQDPTVNVFARDKILDTLAAWAGPGDVPLLVRSLDSSFNDKVLDALVRMHNDEAARGVAKHLGGLTFFKASDTLKRMGPVAEDAVADQMLNSPDLTAKHEAVRILEQIGTRKSIPKVEQAIQVEASLDFQGKKTIRAIRNR